MVVELERLPGLTRVGVAVRVAGRLERRHGDLVAHDVVGVRVAAVLVVRRHHVRPEAADQPHQRLGRLLDRDQPEAALGQRRLGVALGPAGVDEARASPGGRRGSRGPASISSRRISVMFSSTSGRSMPGLRIEPRSPPVQVTTCTSTPSATYLAVLAAPLLDSSSGWAWTCMRRSMGSIPILGWGGDCTLRPISPSATATPSRARRPLLVVAVAALRRSAGARLAGLGGAGPRPPAGHLARWSGFDSRRPARRRSPASRSYAGTPTSAASCLLRAFADDHSVVGELTVPVASRPEACDACPADRAHRAARHHGRPRRVHRAAADAAPLVAVPGGLGSPPAWLVDSTTCLKTTGRALPSRARRPPTKHRSTPP